MTGAVVRSKHGITDGNSAKHDMKPHYLPTTNQVEPMLYLAKSLREKYDFMECQQRNESVKLSLATIIIRGEPLSRQT